jgi:uncharacterized protein involved in exopolysaccharide biosynthesis
MNEDNKSEIKYVMVDSNSSAEDDELDLLELIRTLLRSWKLIVCITTLCTGLAVAYALLAQEVFKAEILLAPVQEKEAGISSSLTQFGGLAAMAGVSIPSDSSVEQVVATLNSRRFLRLFIEKKNLLTVLYEEMWDDEKQVWLVESSDDEPTILDAITTFQKGVLSVVEDKKSGLITLSVSWKDSQVAAEWANDLIKQLNEQLREQAIRDSKKRVGYLEQELSKTTLADVREVLYNLLESEKQKAMLANVNEDFALEVIDPAVAPENREKPKRKLIVVLGGVCGGFLGIFAVFFLQFLEKLKSSGEEKNNPSHV